MYKIGFGLGCMLLMIVILMIAFVPWAFLFGTNLILESMGHAVIPITFKTWLGAFIVLGAMKATVTYKKERS